MTTKKKGPGRPRAGFARDSEILALVEGARQKGVLPATDFSRWQSERDVCKRLEAEATKQGLMSKRGPDTRVIAGASLTKRTQRIRKAFKRLQVLVGDEYRASGIEPPAPNATSMTRELAAAMNAAWHRAFRKWAAAEGYANDGK